MSRREVYKLICRVAETEFVDMHASNVFIYKIKGDETYMFWRIGNHPIG